MSTPSKDEFTDMAKDVDHVAVVVVPCGAAGDEGKAVDACSELGEDPTWVICPECQKRVLTEVDAPKLGVKTTWVTCPKCKELVPTVVESVAGRWAWFCGLLITILGFWCFACVPCCLRSCRIYTHTCPNCKALVGKHIGNCSSC